MTLGDTPWVDRSFRTAWERIAAHVPPSWMPQREGHKLVEFACGSYGCVMPTNEPGLVCKLTTDVSEAHFIRMSQEVNISDMMSQEMGIVQYKKIFKLDGLSHKKRPMFVLWRTEAYDVGLLRTFNPSMAIHVKAQTERITKKYGYDEYHLRNILTGDKLLQSFIVLARLARESLIKRLKNKDVTEREEVLSQIWKSYEDADRFMDSPAVPRSMNLAVSLRTCLVTAQEMSNTDVFSPIGNALAYYLEEGILLADVHLANIGREAPYEPGDQIPSLVITDPGHAVEFHPRWAELPPVEVI